MTSEQFRLMIGRSLGWDRLRSDLYEVRANGDTFVFQGSGSGHGVGMCQSGAASMGDGGRSYREILAYYYPGATAGITAQGLTWNYAGGERIDLQTTRLSHDRRLIPIADRLVREIEQDTGARFERRPVLRAYPTVSTFRDSTGEPGWMAASTRGRMIRLQPIEALAASLENTLEHELLHVLIAESAGASLPAWFSEGLVLALSEPDRKILLPNRRAMRDIERSLQRPRTREELNLAYREAHAVVRELIATHGKRTVLEWVKRGIPRDILGRM
jgi:stage II sporulation protein D